jgi:hypothetical protein
MDSTRCIILHITDHGLMSKMAPHDVGGLPDNSCHVALHIVLRRFLSVMESYDVASICHALPRITRGTLAEPRAVAIAAASLATRVLPASPPAP